MRLGLTISIGLNILIPIGYLGLQESDWGPDAKEWRPTRWLRQDGSFDRNAGPDGSPFGLGHRTCFGQKLAVRLFKFAANLTHFCPQVMQLKTFIAILSRAFLFKPIAPEVDSWDSVT